MADDSKVKQCFLFLFFFCILTQSGAQFLQFLFYMMLKANFMRYHLLCEELYFLICCCFFKFDLTFDFQGREQFVYWRNPQVNALLPAMYFTTSWRKKNRLIHRHCWGKTLKSYIKLSIHGVPSWCRLNSVALAQLIFSAVGSVELLISLILISSRLSIFPHSFKF